MPPIGQDLEAIRLRRDRERRSRGLIKEVAVYIVFLLLISYIAWGHNDYNVFRTNYHLYTKLDASWVGFEALADLWITYF